MSRVGKHPVILPSGVQVNLSGAVLKATGKNGNLELPLHEDVEVKVEDGKVVVAQRYDTLRSRKLWGTYRSLVNNVVKGVAEGFTINLEINGVGYRAAVNGSNLVLQLGFSHDVVFPIPQGIQIKCDKPTSISISGADKQKVGQTAAVIRSFKRPEPYKGKGIKYDFETVRRKESKKK